MDCNKYVIFFLNKTKPALYSMSKQCRSKLCYNFVALILKNTMINIVKVSLLLVVMLLCESTLFAQEYTISGRVKDAANGETLLGATVLVESGGGAITNEYGFYSLSLEKGKYRIT